MQILIQSPYMHCYPLLSLAPDKISLKVSAVTTSSITVIPSGPSGEVSYGKAGSRHGPTPVPYSTRITIPNLKPNTWYTIKYTVQNSYGMKMTKVRRLTIPEGESIYYGSLFCHPWTLFTLAFNNVRQCQTCWSSAEGVSANAHFVPLATLKTGQCPVTLKIIIYYDKLFTTSFLKLHYSPTFNHSTH